MSAQHTPGPWILTGGIQLVGNPMKDGVHSLYVGEIRHDAHIGSVCTIQSADHVPPDGITRDTAAANARLIAAAPELLEALQLIVQWDAEYLALCEHHIMRAAAAIAKATGSDAS